MTKITRKTKITLEELGHKVEPHPDTDALAVRVDITETHVPMDADPAEAKAVIDAWAKSINDRADRTGIVRRQTAELAAQRLRANRKQAERAKQGGKLTDEQKRRMRQQHALRVSSGLAYGAIKALATAFGVDRRTVRRVLDEEK
jgi:DNA invertase Pin-like site-specific DNA recombinase